MKPSNNNKKLEDTTDYTARHIDGSVSIPMVDDQDISNILPSNNLFDDHLPPLNGNKNEKYTDNNRHPTYEIEDIINPGSDFNSVLSPLQFNDDATSNNHKSNIGTQLVRRSTPIGIYQNKNNNQLLPVNTYASPISSNFPHTSAPSNPNGTTAVKRSTTQKSRPTFVNKLWNMINDDSNFGLIQWSDDGRSFVVTNKEELVHEVLPKYFKHSNFASFVRQLNMYGWHKVQDIKSGSIQNSFDDKWQFVNDNFIRGREDLLENIVRQKSNSANTNANNLTGQNNSALPQYNINGIANGSNLLLTNEASSSAPSDGTENININVHSLLSELEKIKYSQMAISKDLLRVSKDNEMLWKENMLARERHRNQQDALEKIFRFLASVAPHIDQKMLTDRISSKNSSNINIDNINVDTNNSTFNDINNIIGDYNNNNIHSNFVSGIDDTNISNDMNTVNTGNVNSMFNIDFDNLQDSAMSPLKPQLPQEQAQFVSKPRFLLKNKANSPATDGISSENSTNIGDDFNEDLDTVESSGRISEIPYHEENDNTSEARTTTRNSDATLSSTVNTYVNNDIVTDEDTQSFLSHLQTNIDQQDARIQHLEDMVNVMSPNGFDLQDYFGDAANNLKPTMSQPSRTTGTILNDHIGLSQDLLFPLSPHDSTLTANKRLIETIDDEPSQPAKKLRR